MIIWFVFACSNSFYEVIYCFTALSLSCFFSFSYSVVVRRAIIAYTRTQCNTTQVMNKRKNFFNFPEEKRTGRQAIKLCEFGFVCPITLISDETLWIVRVPVFHLISNNLPMAIQLCARFAHWQTCSCGCVCTFKVFRLSATTSIHWSIDKIYAGALLIHQRILFFEYNFIVGIRATDKWPQCLQIIINYNKKNASGSDLHRQTGIRKWFMCLSSSPTKRNITKFMEFNEVFNFSFNRISLEI